MRLMPVITDMSQAPSLIMNALSPVNLPAPWCQVRLNVHKFQLSATLLKMLSVN